MTLIEYPEPYAVVSLLPTNEVPGWANYGRFTSITRAPDELSVICQERYIPPEQPAESGWYLIGCQGPLSFSAVGILAKITAVLADAGIPILTVVTYNTDYILTRNPNVARDTLQKAGYEVIRASASETNN